MTKRILANIALGIVAATAMAQETYESAQVMTKDLNGTARYVGMGGAMEALGADISTIGTNPAGVGLMRKSWIGVSAGATIQQGNDSPSVFNKTGVTNVDLNQAGFVYSKTLNKGNINFGFNFQKSRNFNQIINAVNSLSDASYNKASFIAFQGREPYNTKNWLLNGDDSRWDNASYFEDINDVVVISPLGGYSSANKFNAMTENSGYISDFDFNLSGNINDRVFLGLTFGLKSVIYRNNYYYQEDLVLPDLQTNRGTYLLTDEREIVGSGFDFKFGTIFRVTESSPFRIGLYIHTPTWYSLSCSQSTYATADIAGQEEIRKCGSKIEPYDYKITTPWKFGISAGHTIGKSIAIGATYEYGDYSSVSNMTKVGTFVDTYYTENYNYWTGDYYDREYNVVRDRYDKDEQMNINSRYNLCGVHTLKLGAEVRPIPQLALRIGYNYVSPIYKKDASKDLSIDNAWSIGNRYANYAFTNWGDTHRVTFGFGYVLTKHINIDLSYQHATQIGTFYPFQSLEDIVTYLRIPESSDVVKSLETNLSSPTPVKNNRHQINVSLSYRF